MESPKPCLLAKRVPRHWRRPHRTPRYYRLPCDWTQRQSACRRGSIVQNASMRVEAMNRAGGPAAVPEFDRGRRQMLASKKFCWYASRLPFREMAGQEAPPPPIGRCCGSACPEAFTRRRLPLRDHPETKTISWPFEVHVGLQFISLLKVSCRGSAFGFRSWFRSSK